MTENKLFFYFGIKLSQIERDVKYLTRYLREGKTKKTISNNDEEYVKSKIVEAKTIKEIMSIFHSEENDYFYIKNTCLKIINDMESILNEYK